MSEPPRPKAILRGHKAQVHSACFIRHGPDVRLLTGDADGFVVAWDLTIARPRAVWQAHEGPILGTQGWGDERVITHGRDNKLVVWSFKAADEANYSTALPLENVENPRLKPWILTLLDVNSMNFCAFASCPAPVEAEMLLSAADSSGLLVAVPNAIDHEAVDVFHLPSRARQRTVSPKSSGLVGSQTGMPMALAVQRRGDDGFILVCGYENGLAAVYTWETNTQTRLLYRAQAHSQPILSLDIRPQDEYFLTSGADAIIAKHPLAAAAVSLPSGSSAGESTPSAVINTKHSGQQSLRIRSDGRVFATAGWDGRVRVYSAKTMKEVAVLKWHEVGCYATAFAEVDSIDTAQASGNRREMLPESTVAHQNRDMPLTTETVRNRRIRLAQTAHWLAAGSKDGKVSLWEVF